MFGYQPKSFENSG